MLELKSNLDPIKFLKKIEETKEKLYQSGIENKFPDDQIEQFKDYRRQWTIYVEKARLKHFSELVEQLKQNEADFEVGIEAINREIQEINDTVAFLDLVGRTIATLGRIVTLPI